MRRFLLILIGILVFIAANILFWGYYFVVGYGSKEGELNYFMHKGYLFKTYEGRLIQAGFKPQNLGGVQSNEFQFSVTDEKVANQLMRYSGKRMQLHYKEYKGALPWRGMSRNVVDSIMSISDPLTGKEIPF